MVVLPAPVCPTRAVVVPGSTKNEMPRRPRWLFLYVEVFFRFFVSFRTRSGGTGGARRDEMRPYKVKVCVSHAVPGSAKSECVAEGRGALIWSFRFVWFGLVWFGLVSVRFVSFRFVRSDADKAFVYMLTAVPLLLATCCVPMLATKRPRKKRVCKVLYLPPPSPLLIPLESVHTSAGWGTRTKRP